MIGVIGWVKRVLSMLAGQKQGIRSFFDAQAALSHTRVIPRNVLSINICVLLHNVWTLFTSFCSFHDLRFSMVEAGQMRAIVKPSPRI
jgi:hypothetical protein